MYYSRAGAASDGPRAPFRVAVVGAGMSKVVFRTTFASDPIAIPR